MLPATIVAPAVAKGERVVALTVISAAAAWVVSKALTNAALTVRVSFALQPHVPAQPNQDAASRVVIRRQSASHTGTPMSPMSKVEAEAV